MGGMAVRFGPMKVSRCLWAGMAHLLAARVLGGVLRDRDARRARSVTERCGPVPTATFMPFRLAARMCWGGCFPGCSTNSSPSTQRCATTAICHGSLYGRSRPELNRSGAFADPAAVVMYLVSRFPEACLHHA